MKCFVVFASLLVLGKLLSSIWNQDHLIFQNWPLPVLHSAFSAPIAQEPHFKVIYNSGEITLDAENVLSIEVNRIPVGLEFIIKHDKLGDRHSDNLVVPNELVERNDLSFVVERKQGFDCGTSLYTRQDELMPRICAGELDIREIRADEKPVASQTSKGKPFKADPQ